MLKLIKIEKNAIIYKYMPFLVYFLKLIDNRLNALLKKSISVLISLKAWYNAKISKKIDNLYIEKSIIKIKPKFPKVKKKKAGK
jgi:hypothetical protein